ncbi:MAG: hypothetical protein IT179_05880 [Acidobacteria bacterium]|nr:hypothetical protein [Acidobacteriota bacterium]
MLAPVVSRVLAAAIVTGGLVRVTLLLGPPPPPRWTITHRVSAHRALVVEVETRHLDEAAAIARAISDAEQPHFDEILVFFHSPGRRDMLRRIQWTRAHGYVETMY